MAWPLLIKMQFLGSFWSQYCGFQCVLFVSRIINYNNYNKNYNSSVHYNLYYRTMVAITIRDSCKV